MCTNNYYSTTLIHEGSEPSTWLLGEHELFQKKTPSPLPQGTGYSKQLEENLVVLYGVVFYSSNSTGRLFFKLMKF